MPIIAENKGNGNYEPIPAGNYVARCYQMIHIGTVTETIMGVEKKLNKVRLTFELPTETKVFKEENGEQPHVISKEFTLSMHEKSTLRKYLESWRGKGFTELEAERFDITVLCGKPCMLNIIHNVSKNTGKTYADISSISAMPKGLQCPPQVNENSILSYDDFDHEKFEALPDFIKEKVKASEEYQNMMNAYAEIEKRKNEPVEEEENELPF